MNFEKHAHSVVDLLMENFQDYSKERFHWFYQEHPYGLPKTILAECKETGEIVGSGSLTQRYFFLNNIKFLAGMAVDFNIKKKHRVFGPATILQKTILDAVKNSEIDLILVSPGQAAKGVFARIGYEILGESKKYSKTLKIGPKIDHHINIPMLSRMVSIFLDRALWLIDIIKLFPRAKGTDIEILSECDERFNSLWEKGKSSYHIIGERSASYLNWRFIRHNKNQNRIFCIKNKTDHSLKGYIIFNVKDNIATIVDLFTINEKNILTYLLLKFSFLMRKQHVNVVQTSFLGSVSFKKYLKKAMFIERGVDRLSMLFIGEKLSEGHKTQIFDSDNWYLFKDEIDL